MKPDYTHIAIVLDRSGSMSGIASDTIGGFNQFLKTQQETPGQCTFTLVQFDQHEGMNCIETMYNGFPVRNVTPLNARTYVPRGNTPLYDAIGLSINAVGKFLKALPEHERPARVVFAIITDGYENASREFDQSKVFAMINHQRDAYKWEFLFMGANQDAYAVGAGIGIPVSHAINYCANVEGTHALYASMGGNVRAMRCATASGDLDADAAFSDEDRAAQEKAKH